MEEKPRSQKGLSLHLGKDTASFRTVIFSPPRRDNTTDVIGSWGRLNEIKLVAASLLGGSKTECV